MAKGVVLEGVLGHGNSGIMHTVSNKIPVVTYLPFARLWIPWLVKLLAFHRYNPLGKQVFSSAKKLSPNIPVIIMHNINDHQLSINDARETYRILQNARQDKNVYLMELNNPSNDFDGHFNLLLNQPEQQVALQAIYRKHGLPYNTKIHKSGVDLTDYQPSVKDVARRIKKSSRASLWTRNVVDAFAATAIISVLYLKYVSGNRP